MTKTMNPENTETPNPVSQPKIQSPAAKLNSNSDIQEHTVTMQKSMRSYLWYYVPLVATLILVVLTQLATNHVCRDVAPSDKGECIPGLWFFPSVIVGFFGFWIGIVLASVATVRIIKTRRKR
jgi:hypothetical protein